MLALVEGYNDAWQDVMVKESVIELPVKRAKPLSRLTGAIVPVPRQGNEIRLFVDGGLGEGRPDSLGRFDFPVRAQQGERIRLKVYVSGQLRYDEYQTLPGPVTLRVE